MIVHVTVWKADAALTVPVGSLFRRGDDGPSSLSKPDARATLVNIGHRNAQLAAVLSGLSAGNRVVLHPSDRVKEGAAVAQRQAR